MKVIGTGSVHIYEGIDECPHQPDNETLWQESFVVFLWDPEQQIYVFLRMSQEPNRDGKGYTTVWLNAWAPGYMYKHTDDSIPFAPGDRSEKSLSAGGGLCRYEYRDGDSKYLWSVDDKEHDVKMRLAMEDYHPGFGYHPEAAGAAVNQSSKHHIEAAGWVSGTVTIKGKTYHTEGPGWRDHSWGKRNWQTILAHRFYPAMFGRDFSFFCVSMVGVDGNQVRAGTIIRGDTVEATTDFDVVALMGEDGTSNIGGEVTLRMNGQSHVLRYHPVGKGAVSLHQGFPCVDTMCRVTMDGKEGVGIAETSHRPQGGTNPPYVFPNSPCVLENGLHAF